MRRSLKRAVLCLTLACGVATQGTSLAQTCVPSVGCDDAAVEAPGGITSVTDAMDDAVADASERVRELTDQLDEIPGAPVPGVDPDPEPPPPPNGGSGERLPRSSAQPDDRRPPPQGSTGDGSPIVPPAEPASSISSIQAQAPSDGVGSGPSAVSVAAGSLALALLMFGIAGIFVLIQNRIDRNDPRLALAPARSDAVVFR